MEGSLSLCTFKAPPALQCCRLTQNPLSAPRRSFRCIRLSSVAVDISLQDSHAHCFVLICGSAWRVWLGMEEKWTQSRVDLLSSLSSSYHQWQKCRTEEPLCDKNRHQRVWSRKPHCFLKPYSKSKKETVKYKVFGQFSENSGKNCWIKVAWKYLGSIFIIFIYAGKSIFI